MANQKENTRLLFNQLLTQHSQCELCMEPACATPFLCRACYQQLLSPRPCCSQCSEPLFSQNKANSQRCGQCQQSPPGFDYSHCHYLYRPPISFWIQQLKDKHQLIWCRKLARLMTLNPPDSLQYATALTYIPSTRLSLLKRGFNVSELLARELARKFRFPLLEGALKKTAGKDQRSLNRQQRRKNLKQTLKSANLDLAGQHILIVDDVMTTGATLDRAAHCLKQQGAHAVGGWILARTPAGDSNT